MLASSLLFNSRAFIFYRVSALRLPAVYQFPEMAEQPFLKGHKNDYRDAEAIAEAVQRPTMQFVSIKTPEQMDLLALHRVRSRWSGSARA